MKYLHRLVAVASAAFFIAGSAAAQNAGTVSNHAFAIGKGPTVRGEALFQGIQPVARLSALQNDFKGPPTFPAPSIWWNWVKLDYGVRIAFAKSVDVTIEHAKHNIVAPRKLNLGETLATLRIRV